MPRKQVNPKGLFNQKLRTRHSVQPQNPHAGQTMFLNNPQDLPDRT